MATNSSRMSRRLFVAAVPLITLTVGRRGRAALKYGRDPKDARWYGGEAAVSTNPNSVWIRLQDVDKWPQIFSDIKSLKVKKHKGDEWTVEIESRTMTCGSHDWIVRFLPNRTIEMAIGAPGIKARGVTMVKEGKSLTNSVVTYWLFIEVTGVVGWFVSEKDLRQKQEKIAQANLRDLEKVFGVVA